VDDGAGVSVVMFTRAAGAAVLKEGDVVTVTGVVKDAENRATTGECQSVIKSPKFSGHQAVQG